jgi:hypothetical protein
MHAPPSGRAPTQKSPDKANVACQHYMRGQAKHPAHPERIMTRLLIVLSSLHLALAVCSKGADTNSVPVSPYKAVHIHNDSEPSMAEPTSSRPATIYEIVVVSDQPSRGGLVASEREFRFASFGGARHDGGVNIPHAMQQPRRRLFDDDSDDDLGETIFGISPDSLDLNGPGTANQGWLAREVNRNVRSGRDMRMLNENMIRENTLMQNLGLKSPLNHMNPNAFPMPNNANTPAHDPYSRLQSRGLLDRDILSP